MIAPDGRHDHDHDDLEREHEAIVPPGPIAQSVTVGFRAIYLATLLLAIAWLGSNTRQIATDSQAVIIRFGRVVRVEQAGLLLALPPPFEQIRLLPGPDRQLSQEVQALPPSGGIEAASSPAVPDATSDTLTPGTMTPETMTPGTGPPDTTPESGAAPPPDAAPYLTGDGNVVLLNATLTYRIVDPRSFILAQDHLQPALDRLFRAAAVAVTAGRRLNDFLVAPPRDEAAAIEPGPATTDLGGAVRDALLRGINAGLAGLASTGAGTGLGIEVERIDLTAWLPPDAKLAFDAVLTATQDAERNVAAARTAAELRRQVAARQRDELISAAQAGATEQVTNAHASTARIVALEHEEVPATRDTLILQTYRAQLADIMRRVGGVTVVDPNGAARVILSGGS